MAGKGRNGVRIANLGGLCRKAWKMLFRQKIEQEGGPLTARLAETDPAPVEAGRNTKGVVVHK